MLSIVAYPFIEVFGLFPDHHEIVLYSAELTIRQHSSECLRFVKYKLNVQIANFVVLRDSVLENSNNVGRYFLVDILAYTMTCFYCFL